jgi:hypothetical protein
MHSHAVEQAEISVTRRRLLAGVGWGSFAAFWGSSALAIGQFFFPGSCTNLWPAFRPVNRKTIKSARSAPTLRKRNAYG